MLALLVALTISPTPAQASSLKEASQLIRLLSRHRRAVVTLPPASESNNSQPYVTYASGGVMKCMTRLERELDVPPNQTYLHALSDLLDPKYAVATEAARQFYLSVDDVLTVDAYTGSSYFGPINSALRSGKLRDYGCYIHDLERSLMKFPKYKGAVIRGTELPAGVLAQHTPGRIVTYKAFTSATVGDDLSEYFRDEPVILRIDSIDARDISEINDDESEVIFLPGTRFKILSRKNSEDAYGPVTIIRMREISLSKDSGSQ